MSEEVSDQYYFDEVSLCIFVEEFLGVLIDDSYKKVTRRK